MQNFSFEWISPSHKRKGILKGPEWKGRSSQTIYPFSAVMVTTKIVTDVNLNTLPPGSHLASLSFSFNHLAFPELKQRWGQKGALYAVKLGSVIRALIPRIWLVWTSILFSQIPFSYRNVRLIIPTSSSSSTLSVQDSYTKTLIYSEEIWNHTAMGCSYF